MIKRWRRGVVASALVLVGIWLIVLVRNLRSSSGTGFGKGVMLKTSARPGVLSSTLVMYVFSKAEYARENLIFFLVNGLDPTLAVTYYIVLQSAREKTHACGQPMQKLTPEAAAEFGNLPNLPSNAKYIIHTNECYDLGTYGWLLNCLGSAVSAYRYFVFINSSVRGPFIPTYAAHAHWTMMLTQNLRGNVKLIGSTINCEIMPHVQSYAFATDDRGLAYLRSGGALNCHRDRDAAIMNGELHLSRVMYLHGFTIASLMADQRHIKDWAAGARKYCTTHPQNPTVEGRAYRALHPFEVLFVKVKNDTESRGVTYSGQKEALFFSNV